MKFRDFITEKTAQDFQEGVLTEAKYGSGRMHSAAKELILFLGKRLGKNLYPYGGWANYSESYAKSNGNRGVGFRFISDDGEAYRIDFDAQLGGELSGVSVWNSIKKENPDYYIMIPKGLNSIQAAKHIVSSLIDKGSTKEIDKIVEAFEKDEESEDPDPLQEAKQDWSYLDPSLLDGRGSLRRGAWEAWKKLGIDLEGKTWSELKALVKAVSIQNAGQETTSRNGEEEKAIAALDAKKYADADTIFEDLKDLVNMVVKGGQPSLLVTGMAGVGKTFTVTEVITKALGPEGKRWVVVKGKATPSGLYQSLFLYRDKVVVFDDCDSVFGDKDAINILKAALDSYDTRTVTWMTKSTQDVSQFDKGELIAYYDDVMQAIKNGDPKVKLPNKFEFNGKIIFISNLEAARIDPAIKSRSFVIDVTLRREDLLKRIESLLPSIDPGTDMKLKKEAFKALQEFQGSQTITMRSVVRAIRLRQSGSDRWQELIKNYV